MGSVRIRSLLGTPLPEGPRHGSILSPLLCNIYMHELDKFMTELISSFNRGKTRRVLPRYNALMNKFKRAKTVEEK
jgi:hypothetical protein